MVKAYKFNINRLLTDVIYSVNAGAKILGDTRKRWQKKEPEDYWTRYNSPTHHNRLKYKELVERWMRK